MDCSSWRARGEVNWFLRWFRFHYVVDVLVVCVEGKFGRIEQSERVCRYIGCGPRAARILIRVRFAQHNVAFGIDFTVRFYCFGFVPKRLRQAGTGLSTRFYRRNKVREKSHLFASEIGKDAWLFPKTQKRTVAFDMRPNNKRNDCKILSRDELSHRTPNASNNVNKTNNMLDSVDYISAKSATSCFLTFSKEVSWYSTNCGVFPSMAWLSK